MKGFIYPGLWVRNFLPLPYSEYAVCSLNNKTFYEFINPLDGTHTQNIESLWSKFKKQIKNTKGIAGDKLESLLSELMYKNKECVFAGFEAVLILLRKN